MAIIPGIITRALTARDISKDSMAGRTVTVPETDTMIPMEEGRIRATMSRENGI